MTKTTQTVLLLLFFLVCGAGGYFLGEILIPRYLQQEVEEQPEEQLVAEVPVVEPEPEIQISRVPVAILEAAPKRAKSGNYSFNVLASVESEEQLRYVVYTDTTCTVEVAANLDGVFANIPPANTGTYYVKVQNVASQDYSEIIPVEGLIRLVQYRKITKAELEKLFNVDKSWNAAPDFFPSSLSHNYGSSLTVLGMSPDERKPGSLGDICTKVSIGTWSSATVESISYDNQGRLTKLVVRANY